jgi:hypothetical protein
MEERIMKAKLFSIVSMVAGCWLATGVAWADAPFPVPAKGGLVQYAEDLAVNMEICSGNLDSCDIALYTCADDLTDCQVYADFLENKIKQCKSDLSECQAYPATGQTSCWDSFGRPLVNCTGTGHDGDKQAGAALSYTETGLTIIDNNTQLEWMKQDNDSLNLPIPGTSECSSYGYLTYLDKDCIFTWDEAFAFVGDLNKNNHAGHSDWRMPNVKELQSIVNFGKLSPALSAEFNDDECAQHCTVETCSCNGTRGYWSSTSHAEDSDNRDPGLAYSVTFANGTTGWHIKNAELNVRAVRGGL